MRLVHGTFIGAWVVIGLNLLLAFGAIAVFARMTPEIAIILEQNDQSIQAAERMLVALTLQATEEDGSRSRFGQALAVAKGNVTEPEEPGILEEIERFSGPALSGDPVALRRAVSAIERLTDINRAAMAEAERRAEQLGSGGGWSVAIMAGISFTASLVLLRALNKRLMTPLEEMHAAVTGYLAGDEQRRCYPATADRELKTLCAGLNRVLDRATRIDARE